MEEEKKETEASENGEIAVQEKKKSQAPVWIGMIFAVFVIAFGIYHVYRTVTQYDRADREYSRIQDMAVTQEEEQTEEESEPDKEPGIRVDIKTLQKKNPDTVGWLYYPLFQINYPIMQDDDNTYYIKHTFEGEKNAAGSIFLDCNASGNFEDMHALVYGHNMKDGSMFGDLKEIREEGTVKENPYFWIFTENDVYTYRIFSYHDADVKDDSFQTVYEDEEAYEKFLEHLIEMSEEKLNVTPQTNDKVITLSTCTSDSTVRFLVHGMLEE